MVWNAKSNTSTKITTKLEQAQSLQSDVYFQRDENYS